MIVIVLILYILSVKKVGTIETEDILTEWKTIFLKVASGDVWIDTEIPTWKCVFQDISFKFNFSSGTKWSNRNRRKMLMEGH